MRFVRAGFGGTAAFAMAVFLATTPAWGKAAKSENVRKSPRGDICAETPPFVAMDMLAVSIIRDGSVLGMLNLKPCFAAKPDQADAILAKMPVLQDVYVRRLHLYASTRLDPYRPLDVDALRALLQRASDGVLGQKVPVLLTFVAMRQIG